MTALEWLRIQIQAERLAPTPSMATLAKAAQILSATTQPDKRNDRRFQPPTVAGGHLHAQEKV